MNENDNHLGDAPRVSWLSLILKCSPQSITQQGSQGFWLGVRYVRAAKKGHCHKLSAHFRAIAQLKAIFQKLKND